MGDPEQPRAGPERSGQDGRGGLSASGWAAVTALGAAAITAAVTLVTHFVPPMGAQQVVDGSPDSASSVKVPVTPAPATPTPTAAPSPSGSPSAVLPVATSAAPRSGLLNRLTGTWSGPARSGSLRYTMTLVVTGSCAEGQPCGTLTTDLLPCVATITLVRIDDGPAFDFATESFSPDSSASCVLRTGGGDYFVLGADVLTYTTGYDGGTSGTLRRVR